MALSLFNTLTRTRETFAPLDTAGSHVGMYCCGPTVHDYAHIGNFRTFVFADLVRRYLEFKGYAVRHVMNITDVEDKIIARIRTQKVNLAEYTRKYENAFEEDLRTLNCRPPHLQPRATEHIPEMIGLIARLIQKGLAYQAADGSVYFSIERYQASGKVYGQLLPIQLEALRPGERIRVDEYAKDAVADFALWKARSPEDGEVFWESPWGQGRPGWHIECSAMSMAALGPSFDLHLGGEDLIFPHHEDEIAQSEGAQTQSEEGHFARYWLHVAHLLVEGKKMSKSSGNYFTLRDLLSRDYSGRELRSLLLKAHYREAFNFTFDDLQAVRGALSRLDECLSKLRETAGAASAPPEEGILNAFEQALDDDLNVSLAWGRVFEWIRQTNRRLSENGISPSQAAAAVAAWNRMDSVFGVGMPEEGSAPKEIEALAAKRQEARRNKSFQEADAIRASIQEQGWIVEDTPGGFRLKRA